MAHVHEQQHFDVSPDELWRRIGDFHGLADWHPAIDHQQASADGKVRDLHLGDGGVVVETLLEEGERTYTYSIDSSPLPVSRYTATLSVAEDGEGARADWVANFEPEGASQEKAERIVAGVFRGGLDAL